tara:strand:- start:413 stop:868 length:456 start_codon:yes stop_codon:yes gene_type:complete
MATKKKSKTTKKPYKRKPYQLSLKELDKKTDRFSSNFREGIKAILDMDGLHIADAKFTSLALYLLLVGDVLYTQTSSPFYEQYWKLLELNPDEREKLKMESDEEMFEEPFVFIHKSKLLSACRDLVSGGAVGKFVKELEHMESIYIGERYA